MSRREGRGGKGEGGEAREREGRQGRGMGGKGEESYGNRTGRSSPRSHAAIQFHSG